MSILLTQIRANIHRLLAVIIALMLGTGFLAGTLLFSDALQQSFRNAVTEEYKPLDVIVYPNFEDADPALEDKLTEVEGVRSVVPDLSIFQPLSSDIDGAYINLSALPSDEQLQQVIPLEEGRLPNASGEIALDPSMQRLLHTEVGGQATLPLMGSDGEPTGETRTFTVVGTLKQEVAYGQLQFVAIVPEADLLAMYPEAMTSVSSYYVMAQPGVEEQELAGNISQAFPGGIGVETAQSLMETELSYEEDLTDIIRYGTVGFAVIALVVAGMVVANTLQILIAQRTREIALQRCIGATTKQVRRAVMLEALAVGAIGSLLGIALALLVANATLMLVSGAGAQDMFNQFWDRSSSDVIIPRSIGPNAWTIVLPLAAGLLTTLGAAWLPAHAATRISPLAALRSAQLPVVGYQGWQVRSLIGAFFFLAGAFFLGLGMLVSLGGDNLTGVVIGVFGGFLSAVGVLVLCVYMVPWLVRSFGKLASRVIGTPGRFAVSNCARNPRRTTSTAVALMIGVGLVSMMTVGAAMMKTAFANEIDQRSPIDVYVHLFNRDSGSVDSVIAEFQHVEGVEAVAPVGQLDVTFPTVDSPYESGAKLMDSAIYVDPERGKEAIRSPELLADLKPGHVLVNRNFAELQLSVQDGDILKISGPAGTLDLTVHVTDFIDRSMLITPEDAVKMDTNAQVFQTWIKLKDSENPRPVEDRLFEIAEGQGLQIDIYGNALDRAENNEILDRMVLVATGLLGVAVLISLIGIGNTLTLSVIERTRESALLRSLGCTRRQLRSMLAVEGILLAIAGALIGVILGTIYGVIGSVTLIGDQADYEFTLPLGRLALFLLLAIVAGLLASILPARRAATADPVVALAET